MWRLSFAILLSWSAHGGQLGGTEAAPTLTDTACVYGRGAPVIAAAKAQLLTRFEQQLTQLSLSDDARAGLRQGLDTLAVTHDAPMMQGNDTCVTGTLAWASADDVDWGDGWPDDEVPDFHSVTVVGEGWPQAGITARQAAEKDALRRAVQKVVGVLMANQQQQLSDEQKKRFEEVATSYLTHQSMGVVRQWQQLAQRPLDDSGIELTAHVEVAAATMAERITGLSKQLGSPKVFIEGAQTWLRQQLGGSLAKWNISSVNEPANADMVLSVNSQLIAQGNASQLQLDVTLSDPWGQSYTPWSNQPQLLSLMNNTPNLERKLLEAHLSLPNNQLELRQTLLNAMLLVVENGGPQRELIVPSSLLDSQQLQRQLSDIAGITVVSVFSDDTQHNVRLRYLGNINELKAHLTHQIDRSKATLLAEDANHLIFKRL